MVGSIECHKCGTLNPLGADKCRICGNSLSHEHVRTPGSSVCANCGQPLEPGAELCNSCKMPARNVIMSNLPEQVGDTECVHWSEKPAAAGRSARVAMAGIMILIAGALGIGQAVVALDPDLSESFASAIEGVLPWSGDAGQWVAEYVILQVWTLIAGLLAIAGGVFALTETRFEFAVMGGIFGVLAIGFLIGAFLGLVGLLLIAFSRKEFLPEC
jgi:hypothetical protein